MMLDHPDLIAHLAAICSAIVGARPKLFWRFRSRSVVEPLRRETEESRKSDACLCPHCVATIVTYSVDPPAELTPGPRGLMIRLLLLSSA
jgi:hypothetical protein